MRKFCFGLSFAAMALFVACGNSDPGTGVVDPSTVVAGTLTDDRDGQTYKTVKIGNQVWMAENLNYNVEGSYCEVDDEAVCDEYGQRHGYNIEGPFCNVDDEPDCAKYGGRRYEWDMAQGACPVGWHLPSKKEFEALLVAVGGEETAGKKLKSASGWKEYEGKDGNGDDSFGFSALPESHWRYDWSVYASVEGDDVVFWSSTELDMNLGCCAWGVSLEDRSDKVDQPYYNKGDGHSVRCLKD